MDIESNTAGDALDTLNDELHAAYPTNEEGNVGDLLIAYLRSHLAELPPGAAWPAGRRVKR